MSEKNRKYNEIEAKNNMNISKDEEVRDVPEKKESLKKVVSVEPKKVKKGLLNRLVTGIIGPEGLPGIGSYVNDEIVKPAIKNIIVDAVTSGINMIMYGDRGGGHRGGYRPPTNYGNHYGGGYRPNTNYTSRYTSQQPAPTQPQDTRVRSARYGIEEYIIADRHDAAHVLTTLTEAADRYDTVAVADYYDAIGVPTQYTDNQYGWTYDSIMRATVVPARGGGFVIKFPPVEVI